MHTQDLPPVVTEQDLQALAGKLDRFTHALPPAEQFALARVLQRAADPTPADEVAGYGALYYYSTSTYFLAGAALLGLGAAPGPPPPPGPGGIGR